MRTSRISNLTSHPLSVHRKLGNNAGAHFHSNMQQGLHQQHGQKKSKDQNQKSQQRKLTSPKGRLIMKGILFQGDKGAAIHNRLLYNAHLLNFHTNMKIRNKTYRDSI